MVRHPPSRLIRIEIDSISTGWIEPRQYFSFWVMLPFFSWIDRLDSIGIGGFGHDFKALEGQESPVTKVFNAFGEATGNDGLIAEFFPFVPTKRSRMMAQMRKATTAIGYELLQNCEKMKEGSQSIKDRSILGLLSAFQLYMRLLVIHVMYQSEDKPTMRVSSWCRRKLFQRYVYSVTDLYSA